MRRFKRRSEKTTCATHKVGVWQMALDGRDNPVCEEGVQFGGRDDIVTGE